MLDDPVHSPAWLLKPLIYRKSHAITPKSAKTLRTLTLTQEEMEDSQVERQWTKFQHNFTSAYNFTPSELENLGKLGMDLGPRIVWDILFVTMILVGVAGNLMVLWIVTGTDQFFFSSNVNFFQKHLFLHQLAHNMTKDCLLNYKSSQYEHVVHINCFLFLF